jgi:phosphate transport system substrate-binding protein
MNFFWIYEIPTWYLMGLFTLFFVGITWLGIIFLRPVLRQFVRTPGVNELVGSVLSCFCVFYGLLLGLVAVAAYQNLANVENIVGREGAGLSALYRDISTLPEPTRHTAQNLLREYTRAVIEEDWPAQQAGRVRVGMSNTLAAVQEVLAGFEPQTKGEEVLMAETYRQYNQYVELRTERLMSVGTGIPAVLWYVVIIGAFITIMLVWLFEMRFLPQVFLGGLLSCFVATMLGLIAAMDHPFRGEVSIDSKSFQLVYDAMTVPGASASLAKAPEDIEIRAGGSTLAAGLYQTWFERYGKRHPTVKVSYDAVGSGEGIKRFLAGQLDFCASDQPLTDAEMAQAGAEAHQMPVAAGMVALVYNLPGVNGLRLSREACSGIFLGAISRWDDPLLVRANPGLTPPGSDLTFVARQDTSGTTFLLSTHLSAISQPWKEKYGSLSFVTWSERVQLKSGNEPIAQFVKNTPGAIGYVDLATAEKLKLPAARIENKAGNFIAPSLRTGAETLQGTKGALDLRQGIGDPEGFQAYPFVGYTWLILRAQYETPQKARAIRRLFRWSLIDGQNECERLGYLRLPSSAVARSILTLEQTRP